MNKGLMRVGSTGDIFRLGMLELDTPCQICLRIV